MSHAAAVESWLAYSRPLLPIQNPLWAFVHNNILLQWEDRPFRRAVREAAALYRARPYESERFFRRQLRRGRVERATLGEVLLARWPAERERPRDAEEAVVRFLAEPDLGDDVPPERLVPGPSAEHLLRYSVRDRPLQDWLVPIIASYLDQGLAPWPNPFASEGLWAFFVASVESTPTFGFEWAPELKARLRRHRERGLGLEELIHEEVRSVASADDAASYVLQTLFVLKGWSGMVWKLESEPQVAPAEVPHLELKEWLAVMLVSMHALDEALRRDHPHHRAPVYSRNTIGLGRLERWQEAYERSFGAQLLATLERDLARPLPRREIAAQALLCMDDREESMRRVLEGPGYDIETYGVVGFFNFDMNFHALGAGRASRQCPPVVEPSRTIRELPVDEGGQDWARSRTADKLGASLALALYLQSRTLVRGFFVSLLAGLLSFLPLVFKLLLPSRVHVWRRRLQWMVLPRPATRIEIDAAGGYSPEEQAQIVRSILRTGGLVRDFRSLVAVVGHGSTTNNNPLRQAYGCGACSGNPGKPNARSYALLANRPAVRARLRELGIEIPDATLFVPFFHDTTLDEIELLDRALVPPERLEEVLALAERLQRAAKVNAAERCLRLLPRQAPRSPEAAYEHVQDRGHDLAQPRPEYGHNRVAACIVGRRSCTLRSFLDRRSFLVSYDPTIDPDGSVLRDAVLGTVPVAVNIAMDYYFSRVDNDGFGASSKLPLNVVSLLGVITGSKSDLRIGLARQQIELHEPMRILVLMEAPAERIRALVEGHGRLKRLVHGEWMRLGKIDPESGAIELWSEGEFRPWRAVWPEAPILRDAELAPVFDRHRDHVVGVAGGRA
ncbi:MAG: DUF2309 family protein [Planctomycetes bacterium]|nr:DUF2309 family protein [Planctomycetota bacterium]